MTTSAADVPAPSVRRRPGAGRDFLTGIGLLGRGFGLYLRSPALVGLGLVPALISGMLFLAALVTLAYFVDDLAAWMTGFADGWSAGWRDLVRLVAAAALLGLGALVGVIAFTAVTLVIGDPFYEKISAEVEGRLGGVPGEVVVPWWRSIRRSLADSLRLVATSLLFGVPLFAAGFIPVVGQTVVPVLAAAVGGWFLAVELTGVPFQRRGLRLPDRRRALRAHRPLTLGFGVAVFICCLIPFAAVLIMPAAVAGGTLLSRRVLGLSTAQPGHSG